MKRLTDEERVAKKLAQIVSDVTLDLDQVGVYLATAFPSISYRRLETVISSAEYEREQRDVRNHINPLF